MEVLDTQRTVERVALGYSGGEMEGSDDMDPFTCKLGGKPVWLDTSSPLPDHASVMCGQCGSEMVMLVQTYVPLSDSPYDRVLYVWACNRHACTGKAGAAKAIRAHLLNKGYALKLVKGSKPSTKRPLKSDEVAFGGSASSRTSAGAALFDFGSVWRTGAPTVSTTGRDGLFTGPIFGAKDVVATPSCRPGEWPGPTPEPGTTGSAQLENVRSHLDALTISQNTPLGTASDVVHERVEWPTSDACLPPQYLEFDREQLVKDCIPERYQAEIEQALEAAFGDLGSKGKGKRPSDSSSEWADEKYERATRPKGTDAAFERFTSIVGQNPEQVMRYQFGGQPLLYTMQDSTARKLLSTTRTAHSMASGPNHGEDDDSGDDDDDSEDDGVSTRQRMRRYSTADLPKCPRCNGKRVFECQLMPALLTVLPLSDHVAPEPAQASRSPALPSTGRLVGGRLLQTLDLGMEFGTLMVFVCENDCHSGQTGTEYLGQSTSSMNLFASAAYFDELVLVQLESHDAD
ncbi:hypothetical protein IWW37_004467 [Coemansia sp. RSA 2050]|nr:hypothetical protein IWW37_004467 [Coemansia sp. RSA 2050]KAJ2731290.1 hypothetical protein IW152_004637 [Coemansia sp. BCRC 34962]